VRWSTIKQSRYFAPSFIAITLIVLPFLLALGVETIVRGSLGEAWSWAWGHKELFAMNALIQFAVFGIIYAILGSLVFSVGFTVLLVSMVGLVSYFKVKLIGEPFFPWDVLLDKESFNILPLVTGRSAMMRIGAVATAVVLIVLLRLVLPRLRMPYYGRIALGLFSLYTLYAMGTETPLAGKLLNNAGASEIIWDQQQNYSGNGLSVAFTLNMKNTIVPKPDGYSETAMADLASQIESSRQQAPANKPADPLNGKQPNVIFIMSEAFWDPTLLPDVQFSEDPLKTVHRLQKESTSGYLLSPQFGGGTSNVEFEVLTGYSMSFLPGGSVPYQQYVHKPVPSLASYFEDQGYKSMGIHSYEGWFWNRQTVYQELGFEAFKSKANFDNPEIRGNFIADSEVSKSIIQEVDQTDKPMFIYAITMQNHGPFDDNRYGTNAITTTGPLSPEAKSILETYTQGAHDADQSLQMLIDHFEKSDEPTILVFYGDHLPMLGFDYQVYAEGGFVSTGDSEQWSLEEIKKMHSVPFVTWSNFDLPKADIPVLSPSFLGAKMLDTLNMQKPATFAMDAQVSAQLPGLLSNLAIDASQQLHPVVPDDTAATVEKYREMQYDMLFGKQYLASYIDKDYLTKPALANYNEMFKAPADGVQQAEPAGSVVEDEAHKN